MDIATQVADAVTQVASKGATSATVWAGNFLALLVITVLMILFSYRGGRTGIVSLILAAYMGYALYIVFPFTQSIIGTGDSPLVKAIISIIIFVIATIPPYLIIQRLMGGGFGVLSFVPRFMLSLLAACFFLALAYHVFNISHIYTFSEPLNTLFAPNKYFFWWFIAPLVGIFLFAH